MDLRAQAAQAAAQGQAAYNNYNTQAGNYQNQYNGFVNQANQAQQKVNDYTNYMAGEGSAGNQYNTELGKQLGDLGYSPDQMTAARANLNQATGALSAYSDFANQAASKWGLNAGGFAAANAGALSGLNNNIASNQNQVKQLSDIYSTAQTGANQYAGNVVQGETSTLAGYQNAYQDAANERDSALSMAQFYSDMAQKQGLTNSQQQQYYAAATQAYAAAQQASAQAKLFGTQAAQIQQQIDRTNQLYTNQDQQQANTNASNAFNQWAKANNVSWNGQYDPQNGAKIYTTTF